jgi:sodium/proline symporter
VSGTVIFFLVLYYVVVLAIGYWALRRGGSDDLEGFLLGGRQVGPIATALTLQSTSMSGYMFLGAGGLGFAQGYWALWYAAGDIGGGLLNLSVIGRRMRKMSQMMGALTAIEYLEKRYPSPAIRLVAGTLTVFLLGFYVLAQLIAGGKGTQSRSASSWSTPSWAVISRSRIPISSRASSCWSASCGS